MEARFAGPARAALLAAVLALVSSVVVQPLVGGSTAQAMGPLPDCRYDDLLTSPRLYDDWPVTLVDTILRVPRGYVPPDLVSVSQAGIPGTGKIRSLVIDDLRALAEAASAAHAAIAVQSAYRSYEKQEVVFDGWVAAFGYERALQLSARPGHSEHQLGLAIDFRSHPGGSPFVEDWGRTKAGRWMRAHAWEYGFVMSYPKGRMDVACYDYEPWHFRYVGRDLAAAIHGSTLTPREYLWAAYTTTIVPAVTPRPGKSASPVASPEATPSVEPSDSSSASPSAQAETLAPPGPADSPAPTPGATPPPIDTPPVASLEGGVAASLAVALGAVLLAGWMVLRRGRSGVGL